MYRSLWMTFAVTSAASAGYLSPELSLFLEEAEPEEWVPVLVHVNGDADLLALKDDLAAGGVVLPRRERHQRVVELLRDDARRAQRGLRAHLRRRAMENLARDVRPFWIANVVSAEVLPEVVNEMLARPEVIRITYDRQLEMVEPVSTGGPGAAVGAESGLKECNAHKLWAMGYTGTGVLVSHLDTGVDGNHAALASRWRGLDPGVDPEDAFFDPVTNWTFPKDSSTHGTHTMGTICGVVPGDTVGVAFDAKWISAAVIDRVSLDRTESDAIAAFQWTADPDGDPTTVEDVPVVSSNSWGFSPLYHGVPHCNDVFWATMDGAEAAGVAVVFAAGNEGSASKSLRTPSDRITTEVNAFAVGALAPGSNSIASFSSRGPSGCDNATVKPEVSARGQNVRSSLPGGSYGTMSGTSMAVPHVAGGIALLNQINPNITPERAKEILMETAVDLGATGPDNTFGSGRMDLEAAGLAAIAELGGIFGRVTGLGEPLEGARVEDLESEKFVVTDEDGEYDLNVRPGASYVVRASQYGYGSVQTRVFVPEQTFVEANFDLEPVELGLLRGTVTEAEAGAPLPGVEVQILGTPLEPVLTADDGSYRMAVAGSNAYDVTFKKLGYAPVEVEEVEIDEEGVTVLNLPMEPFPTVLVWEADPTPISSSFIRSFFAARGEDVLVTSELNAYGELAGFERVFVLLGMAPHNAVIEPGGPEDIALTEFISQGSRRWLYLEGGDFWAFDMETQVRPYFGIVGLDDGDDDLYLVHGAPGTPTSGISRAYRGENSFVDDLAVGAGATLLWNNPLDDNPCGVLRRHENGRLTIGQSFEIGGLSGAAAAQWWDRVAGELP